jgi:hypothetical protein
MYKVWRKAVGDASVMFTLVIFQSKSKITDSDDYGLRKAPHEEDVVKDGRGKECDALFEGGWWRDSRGGSSHQEVAG